MIFRKNHNRESNLFGCDGSNKGGRKFGEPTIRVISLPRMKNDPCSKTCSPFETADRRTGLSAKYIPMQNLSALISVKDRCQIGPHKPDELGSTPRAETCEPDNLGLSF
jgi:hypothetical protein